MKMNNKKGTCNYHELAINFRPQGDKEKTEKNEKQLVLGNEFV